MFAEIRQPDPVTLDQVRVFLKVVEQGSFSAAAKNLNRAQSAVSYAINNLEEILGVKLFARAGRKPTLTEAGKALVGDARAVDGQVSQMLARAHSMSTGTEPRVSVAVEALYPMDVLVNVLRAFQASYPMVSLRLRTEALGAVAQLVVQGVCQLGISGPLDNFPSSLAQEGIADIQLVPVVAKTHPLAQLSDPIPTQALQKYTQIVVTDRSALTDGVDINVLSGRTWRVADLGAKHAFLLAGFGWGSMPIHIVRDDLASGRLLRVKPAAWNPSGHSVPLFAIYDGARPPGPAGRWLLEQLATECASGC